MNLILEEIKEIILETDYYTQTFWERVKKVSNRDKRAFSEFLINYLENLNSENIERKNCQMILALVLGLYPFENERIMM